MLLCIYAQQHKIMVTRIQIAKPDIVAEFAQRGPIFRPRDVSSIFAMRRDFWRLTKSMTINSFLKFMLDKTQLQKVRFEFPNRIVTGFTWGDVPTLEVLNGLIDRSHFSHYTALRIHGLTEQVPKTVYISREKLSSSNVHISGEVFDQGDIDTAFKQPPRVSKNVVTLPADLGRVVLLESAYQAGDGITSGTVNWGGERPLRLSYTTLERTLIDVTVRPFYAGGVPEVAKAFENARGEVSGNAMLAMLKRMNFGYPYHQAIGYYLERAGYKQSVVDLFGRVPMERDFYLTHGMTAMRYVNRWRLYVPEGFEL